MGKWLLLGYIGAGNAGDDLMAKSFLAQLDPASLPDVVFLGRSAHRPRLLDGVPVAYAQATPKAILRYGLGAKGLVMLGGTHFHDAMTDPEWRVYRRKLAMLTATMAICRLFGGKVVHLGAGIGPLLRQDARRLTATALKLGSLVVLRDVNSFELSRSLGARRPHEARDLAFLDFLTPRPATAPDSDRRILGLAPCSLSNLPGALPRIDELFWECMCSRVAEAVRGGVVDRVRIFAFCVSGGLWDDRALSESVQSRLTALGVDCEMVFYDHLPDAILRSLRDCSVFMAFRYHAAIMAALEDRRTILVPYHRKVLDLIKQLSLNPEDVLDVQQPSEDALRAEIGRVIDRLDQIGRPAVDRDAAVGAARRSLDLAAEIGVPVRPAPGSVAVGRSESRLAS